MVVLGGADIKTIDTTELAPNFRRAEFSCSCGCGFAAPDPRLVAQLQHLRDALGKPIRILSGCRCAAHNAAVGGARNSQHVAGRAADIRVTGMTARELYAAAWGLFGGYGVDDERGFVHVDTRSTPARWTYRNGREAPWTEW